MLFRSVVLLLPWAWMFCILIDLCTNAKSVKTEMVGGMITNKPNPWPVLIQPLPKRKKRARCGAVRWGIALQRGRSRVAFPLGHWDFFVPFSCTVAVGSTQPLTEWIPGVVSPGCKGGRYVGLTTLPPSCADCLEILGSSNYWNPRACPDLCRDFFSSVPKKSEGIH